VGKFKGRLRTVLPHKKQPLLQRNSLTARNYENYRDSTPWFHGLGSPTGCRRVFISYRDWGNILDGTSTRRKTIQDIGYFLVIVLDKTN